MTERKSEALPLRSFVFMQNSCVPEFLGTAFGFVACDVECGTVFIQNAGEIHTVEIFGSAGENDRIMTLGVKIDTDDLVGQALDQIGEQIAFDIDGSDRRFDGIVGLEILVEELNVFEFEPVIAVNDSECFGLWIILKPDRPVFAFEFVDDRKGYIDHCVIGGIVDEISEYHYADAVRSSG